MSPPARGWPAIAVVWLGAALLAAAALVLVVRQEVEYRAASLQQATSQADVLAGSVSAALAFEDQGAMRQYLDALMRNPQIAAAAIYGPQGRRLMLLMRADASPPPAHLAQSQSHWTSGRPIVSRVVAEQGDHLGYVYVQMQPDTLSGLVDRHAALIVLTLLALALLAATSRSAANLSRVNARLTQEIGARAAAEEALRQSQKLEALGQLTGGIAHDFNNLLQAIHGAFELIIAKAAEERTVRRWAQNGLEAAERGGSLTRQLLAFSRQQKLETKPVVVETALDGMRDLLARTLGPRIELVFDLAARGAAVMTDATQLELAVMNLAVNARDAMPSGGRLTIWLRRVSLTDDPVLEPGEYLELRVTDTGEGMPLEVLSRAFDPFFTTKALGKGTGLGLAQVYGLARQAAGDTRIVSAPGEGATVALLLPIADAGAAAAPAAAIATGSGMAARPAIVLLVDDDDAVRRVVRGGLEQRGFKVIDAGSGEAALAIAETSAPEIAVIDYAMPGMDGAETAERLRRLRPGLPIILASGHADTAAVERALGGQATLLRKPFDMGALAEAVALALPRAPPK